MVFLSDPEDQSTTSGSIFSCAVPKCFTFSDPYTSHFQSCPLSPLQCFIQTEPVQSVCDILDMTRSNDSLLQDQHADLFYLPVSGGVGSDRKSVV